MPILLSEINFLAVLVAALTNFLIGGVWYSPMLFARLWMKELDTNPVEAPQPGSVARAFLGAFFCALVTAVFLSIFIVATQTYSGFGGAEIGFLAALGFVATSLGTNFLFEKRSRILYQITAGHHILAFTVMGAILGGWR